MGERTGEKDARQSDTTKRRITETRENGGRQSDSRKRGMGWLRLVGSMKLKISFAEYSLFYRALLQERPMILSILLAEAAL